MLRAIDHTPSGDAHRYAWSSPTDLCSPIGWLGWRLAYGAPGELRLRTPTEHRLGVWTEPGDEIANLRPYPCETRAKGAQTGPTSEPAPTVAIPGQ
jgi:hypothetical protein